MYRPVARTFAILVLLAVGSQQVAAQLEKGTLWRDAIVTKLDVDFPGTGFHGRWIYHRCLCGDLFIEVEQVAPDGVLTGDLLMVDGQVLLARGFAQQATDLKPLMQAPTLMLQLALALLNRSQPQGPAAVTAKQQWDSAEAKLAFGINTGMATGTFAAPWGVKGTGWRAAAGRYRFELAFHFTNPLPDNSTAKDEMQFSGELNFRNQEFPLAESANLQGWKIQWLSKAGNKSKQTLKALTLKALRQQANNSRG